MKILTTYKRILPSTNKVHVVIHQSPTAKNVVWKQYVNLDRVYCALEYLKEHFDDYKDVNVKSREEFARELDEMLIEQVDSEDSDGEIEKKTKGLKVRKDREMMFMIQ